jgi:hypothetical protein
MPAVAATTIENRRSHKKISSCFIIKEKIKIQFDLSESILAEYTFSILNDLRLIKGNHHASSYPPARPVVTPMSRQGFIVIQK